MKLLQPQSLLTNNEQLYTKEDKQKAREAHSNVLYIIDKSGHSMGNYYTQVLE